MDKDLIQPNATNSEQLELIKCLGAHIIWWLGKPQAFGMVCVTSKACIAGGGMFYNVHVYL